MSPSDQILAQTLHMYVCMYVCIYLFISEWIHQNRSKKHQTQSEYRIKSPLTCKSKTYSTHPLSFDYTNPFATHPWKSRQLSCMWLLAMTLSPLHFLWPGSCEGGQCLLSIGNYAMSIELSFPKACFWHQPPSGHGAFKVQ